MLEGRSRPNALTVAIAVAMGTLTVETGEATRRSDDAPPRTNHVRPGPAVEVPSTLQRRLKHPDRGGVIRQE